ncbi:MAG: hypothetical protein JXR03_16970 [Cyclobacteriaceae bacterium]
MGSLSQDQLDKISEDLHQQGITFDPLREELLDHLICDVEIQMREGADFATAWKSVKDEIPNNHFKNIQNETMELLRKKVNPVKIFAIISFGLLAFATLFKILHLQGAGMLMLLFLVCTCATLLVGSTRSIYVYRESRGRGAIVITTILIISFIAGLCFKILHLPGATMLLYFSVITLSILFPALSIYFLTSRKKLKDHLLIKLIEDNQKILERAAMILIGFGLLFNYSSLLYGAENYGGVIFFIFSVIITGIYIYTFTWSHYVHSERPKSSANLLLLIVSSLAFIMFMLPVLGRDLNFVFRQFIASGAMVFFIGIILIHYSKFSTSEYKSILAPMSSFLLFYPLLRLGIKLQWFENTLGGLVTNNNFIIGFLVFLLLLLFAFRKERLFKALIILLIASHMIPTA